MRLALIGMPTCGKSTISKQLSSAWTSPVVDVDALLESEFGGTLQSFIDSNGEARFLEKENQFLLNYTYPQDCIISTGGSVIYATPAMTHLKNIGVKFVYLKASLKTLESRLISQRNVRGIVMNGCKSWEELLAQRHALYEKYADLVISTDNLDETTVARQIMMFL